jgi:hypothetical protein
VKVRTTGVAAAVVALPACRNQGDETIMLWKAGIHSMMGNGLRSDQAHGAAAVTFCGTCGCLKKGFLFQKREGNPCLGIAIFAVRDRI